jgi:hypothetical protein
MISFSPFQGITTLAGQLDTKQAKPAKIKPSSSFALKSQAFSHSLLTTFIAATEA